MTESQDPIESNSADGNLTEDSASKEFAKIADQKYATEFSPIDRRSSGSTGVFSDNDKIFSSSVPRTTHWSIAWSDLMMTMFVLFLSMFVYQAAHQDFLVSDELGIIGGDTTEALEIATEGEATFPFMPIKPPMPLATGGIVKKIQPVPIRDIDVDSPFITTPPEETLARIEKSLETESITDSQNENTTIDEQTETITTQESAKLIIVEAPATTNTQETQDIIEPRPLLPADEAQANANQQIKNIFNTSKENLYTNDLDKYASVHLVPDKTVRIILTGDLLFDLGSADLSADAVSSLRKISTVIKDTPYMINVVGHTDNTPMNSGKFETNWELSVTRASTVARFLINEMKMNPNQFVVSGYSSFRPIKPNTNTSNRAINRRVEIIISKRLPTPIPAKETSTSN